MRTALPCDEPPYSGGNEVFEEGKKTMRLTITNPVRIEEDAMGEVEVAAEHLWGAQTQRSHMNFPIGVERFRWGRPGHSSSRHSEEVCRSG
jgi:hypothetical protein